MKLLSLALLPYALFAQPLSFEVASVKSASAPIKTADEYSEGFNAGMRAALASQGMRIAGQRVNITDNTLKDLIRMAYQVKDYQISGPAWISTEKYEIVANMPAGSNKSQAPEMLRTLLETRFHLQLRRETKKTQVYALVIAKSGLKLAPVDKAGRGAGFAGISEGGRHRVATHGATMAAIADLLTKVTDRPVVDGTGVGGFFDIDFLFSADLDTAAADAAPGLSAALAELGLRLEKRDSPMESLLVDRAEKSPTEN